MAKEKAHRMLEQKDEEIDELKQSILRGADSPITEASNMNSGEMVNNHQVADIGVDRQYLRVSLIKYLTFLAKGKVKEAMKLETVLWTVLQTPAEELEGLEKARKKKEAGVLGYLGYDWSSSSSVAKPLQVSQKSSTQKYLGQPLGAGQPISKGANKAQVFAGNPFEVSMEFD